MVQDDDDIVTVDSGEVTDATARPLALCRSTVEAHGGQLEASSNVGAGTAFRLALPPVSSDA